MASKSNLVNIDAMIDRADFALNKRKKAVTFENAATISIRDFLPSSGLMGGSLKKPDFQRETNHWSPDQVVSLLECFVSGDLIPSVILWQSPTGIFVIDGGHRLSVLKAWVMDDYGDGELSRAFFGASINPEQIRIAEKTRDLVNKSVGSWKSIQEISGRSKKTAEERRKLAVVSSRALPIQWVQGDAEKAESSFFKINKQGTELDEIEEILLRNRKKPIAIAARAIIRSATGHKYWSGFSKDNLEQLEKKAKSIHQILFEPEIKSPIKTLDLPLAGPRGVRVAIQILIDVCLMASRNAKGDPKKIDDLSDDVDGTETIKVLDKTLALMQRITGNSNGSLGLHPAVYFYGPTGRHSMPMFMGTILMVSKKIINNDKSFFLDFSKKREEIEDVLVGKKEIISAALQKVISTNRQKKYSEFLEYLIKKCKDDESLSDQDILSVFGVDLLLVGINSGSSVNFSDDVKSKVFIQKSLSSAIKCTECGGFLDPSKSVSYDHIKDKKFGGNGSADNCELLHPYCNQSLKNLKTQKKS